MTFERTWGCVFCECDTDQKSCLDDGTFASFFCADDSPRKGEIAEAQAQQAAGVMKGLASAFGFGAVIQNAAVAAKKAAELSARCPNDGTLAKPGTRYCLQCGAHMIQPTLDACPRCGTPVGDAKFCPNCGNKIERAPASTKCPNCGTDAKGAKFCPECGTKIG